MTFSRPLAPLELEIIARLAAANALALERLRARRQAEAAG